MIKWIKTKYHDKKFVNTYDEFQQTRAQRNEVYRDKCKKALGQWKVDLVNQSNKEVRIRGSKGEEIRK